MRWNTIVEAVEAMDAMERAAMTPGTGTEGLVATFPELGSVAVDAITVDGLGGPVRARHYRPATPSGTGLVWVHGGGFIGGHLDMDEAHWVSLVLAASGISVLSVDYRLCLGGVRFPAPSDDVLAGWGWAVEHVAEMSCSTAQLHLGGASAGANLVAGVTKRLRDGAGPLPASLVLAYPLVHAALPPASEELEAALVADVDDPFGLTPELVREMNINFAGDDAALTDPYAFAANGDPSGQPPVFILNSEVDHLRASGEAYADQLGAAGVDVRVEFEPGTRHGHLDQPSSAGGQRSVARIAAWLLGESVLGD